MKWFYNLKTAVKLISAFVLVAILLAFIGFYGLSNMGKMKDKMSDMYNERLVPISNTGEMRVLYQRIRVNLLNMQLAQTESDKSSFMQIAEELSTELEEKITAYNKTFTFKEHEQIYLKTVAAWQDYKQSLAKSVDLSESGNDAEFLSYQNGEHKKIGDVLNDALDELIQFNIGNAEQADRDAQNLYASSRSITIIVIIIALILSIGFGYLIAQIIARPLNRVVALVGKVAGGDLRDTTSIDTKDEVGQLAKSINDMVLSLRNTIGVILGSAESVSAASQQISASTEEIAGGTTSQAHAAQTMNELFRELSSAINSVAVSAEQASELSDKTVNIAQDGGKVVRNSIEGMNRVNQQMSRLEEDSNKIGEIIEVIDDIADQTNLLALNAAIEAARAGDQGRGFAVVADEVRKLAERSSEATKQITSIIKGMQENTKQSVKAVGEGVASSLQTGEAFEKIVTMVNESAHKVAEIASASEEQAAQSSEVMASIESISAATEEAAASSEETASTAQSLAQLAEELNGSVSTFKIA